MSESSTTTKRTTKVRYTSNTSLSLGVAKDYEKSLKSTSNKQDDQKEMPLDHEKPVPPDYETPVPPDYETPVPPDYETPLPPENENLYENPDKLMESAAMGDSYYNITTGYEVMAPGVGHGERAEEAYSGVATLKDI